MFWGVSRSSLLPCICPDPAPRDLLRQRGVCPARVPFHGHVLVGLPGARPVTGPRCLPSATVLWGGTVRLCTGSSVWVLLFPRGDGDSRDQESTCISAAAQAGFSEGDLLGQRVPAPRCHPGRCALWVLWEAGTWQSSWSCGRVFSRGGSWGLCLSAYYPAVTCLSCVCTVLFLLLTRVHGLCPFIAVSLTYMSII